jgi:hypothetical protein
MASSSFLKSIASSVKKSGGEQANLKLGFSREKLSLEDYRANWADFINDAREHIDECGKECECSKERKMIARKHGSQWRIKLVRAGIIVPIDGHTDILLPTKTDALSMLEMIANGFDEGDLDDELTSWMKQRDANVEKAKAAKEKNGYNLPKKPR